MTQMKRNETRQVRCGDVLIGGGAPVSIQSMTNVDSRDETALTEQIARFADAGCQIVRISVPDAEAAEVFGRVKRKFAHVPLVADIHFDYRMALEAIRQGADKIRINPGNIGGACARGGAGSQGAGDSHSRGCQFRLSRKADFNKIRRRDRRGFGRECLIQSEADRGPWL